MLIQRMETRVTYDIKKNDGEQVTCRKYNIRCVLCPNRSSVTDTQTTDPLQRITYHKLPANKERRDRWLEFCGHTNESFAALGSSQGLCSNHFEAECFERDLRSELLDGIKRMLLKKDAIPTIRTNGQQLTRTHDQQPTDDVERSRRKAEVEKLLNGEMPAVIPIVNPFQKHLCEERPKAKRKAPPLGTANDTSGPELIRVLSPLSETEMLQRIAQLERINNEQSKLIEQLQQTIDHKTDAINLAKAEMVNIAISLQEIKDNENKHVTTRLTYLLSERFSEGQLAAIAASSVANTSAAASTEVPWTIEDLAKALELRCINQEAFRYVLHHLRYPLPGAPQIERWMHSMYLETGVNKTAFRLLKLPAASLTRKELICSLNIWHTATPVHYDYDRKRDQVFGPNAQLHCIAVQGVYSDWMQLVHVDFDHNYNKPLLEEIIATLHQLGFRVVAITTNCNRQMATVWNVLGVCHEQHFIRHPITGEPVYMFVCPDGMLNAIHRILVDDGFAMQQNNVMITKDNILLTFARLMESVDPRIVGTLLINQRHINSENLDDSSNLSRKLISHSTSKALKILASEGGDDDTLSTLGTLFDIFIDWYELCTASSSASLKDKQQQASSITRLPYGTCEDEQNIILDAMFDVMENFSCTNEDNNFLPEAVLISINSMRKLLGDLRRDYPGQVRYVPMQRLGSAAVRGIISLSNALTNASGMRTRNEVLAHLCHSVLSDIPGSHVSNRLLQLGQLAMDISPDDLLRPDEPSDPDVRGVTEQNACSSLTNLIAARLGHKYEYLGERIVEIDRTNDQYAVKQGSEKLVPSELWSEQATILESYMADMVKERTPALVESLVNHIHTQHPRMGRELVEIYAMKRIAIKMQTLNSGLTALSNE
uniref:THAP-type domain-containing protein n=1 Tax=Anopheles atroparvus TaxID=41427 RepID=A0AAG5DMK3_ANOAO